MVCQPPILSGSSEPLKLTGWFVNPYLESQMLNVWGFNIHPTFTLLNYPKVGKQTIWSICIDYLGIQNVSNSLKTSLWKNRWPKALQVDLNVTCVLETKNPFQTRPTVQDSDGRWMIQVGLKTTSYNPKDPCMVFFTYMGLISMVNVGTVNSPFVDRMRVISRL